MTAPIRRPDEWKTLGNHEQRIRILESVCCGVDSGLAGAIAIRDRSCSWYGMGENCIIDCSIPNFQDNGDGQFLQGDDCTTGSIAGTGTAPGCGYGLAFGVDPDFVAWPLSVDNFAYSGCRKRYCNPSGYPATPTCEIDDGLEGSSSWSFNLWTAWNKDPESEDESDWPTICVAPGVISYGSGGLFGYRIPGGDGLYLSTFGEPVLDTDPPPIPVLSLKFNDGVSQTEISFGDISNDGLWHMFTVTWDKPTMTLSGYRDGFIFGNHVCTADQGIVAGNITVGSLNFGGFLGENWGGWAGRIDEVGIWCDEALVAGDVRTLFLAGSAPPPIVDTDIRSGSALCGEPLCADGDGGATWGNPCVLDAPFLLPAVGMVDVQDVVDALIALGLVSQGT